MKTKSQCVFNFTAALVLMGLAGPLRAGSLWRDGVTDERGMFADKRAKRVGDIVTIIVQESAAVHNTLRLTTDKDAKSGVAGVAGTIVNQFLGNLPTALVNKALQSISPKNGPAPIVPTAPALAVTGQNTYTGGGEIKNSQTITTRCAVQIIDTLPNGNLVFEGLREISFSKERQFASLRGIIRVYDIQPDNTVLSSNVADARIEIVAEGTLTSAQKKGWLLRLDEKVSPY